MEIYKLSNVDPNSMDDVLLKIQRSFNIELDNEGLKDVNTFDGLCDLIITKISNDNTDTYTPQHAFYMLRNTIAVILGIDKCSVKPQTKLSQILSAENRLEVIAEIENEIGFKVNLLQPRRWVVVFFAFLLTGSLMCSYFYWPIGVFGMVISLVSLKLSGKFGKEMYLKTVGDLACKISRESYLQVRRNHCTLSKNEVEKRVKELFVNNLRPNPVMLTRRSAF